MPTRFRFYGTANQGSLVVPAIAADWGNTSVLSGFLGSRTNTMKPAHLYNLNVARDVQVTGMAAGVNAIQWQFVSEPIAAIAIGGTIKGQVMAREQAATANACIQFRAYVISGDGGTVRGVLVGVDNSALTSEFAVTTYTNRKIPRGWAGSGIAMSSVAAQDGDRVVFEIGVRATPADNGNHLQAGTLIGAPASGTPSSPVSDLPEDETTTDTTTLQTRCPWIEISDDLVFIGMHSEEKSVEGTQQDEGQRHGSILLRDPIGGSPTRGIESSQGGGDVADFIQQRIYDSAVGWCYYVKTFRDPLPSVADTQPNHTNNLVGGTHQLLGIRVKD